MTAKEMFEELGYIFEDNNNRNMEILKNIIYRSELKNDIWQEIIFELNDKTIDISKCRGRKVNEKYYGVLLARRCNISIKLLQAINKQIEELGWK